MKFDTNNKLLGGEATSDSNDELQQTEYRPNAAELIDDILSDFMEGLPMTYNNTSNVPQAAATTSLLDMLMTPRQPAVSDNALLDAIDPSSDLGTTLRNKFTELEEISQRLKTRLGRVVHDNIEPGQDDADDDSLEAELERDLDTDCTEDLSLQEFLQLIQSQNKDVDSSTQNSAD